MKAAILHGPRSLRVEASPAPTPAAGEALVRVAVAGLCGTDYSIFSGERPVSYPRVMGHEFVGHVEAVRSAVRAIAICA
jgi:L-gulonate 5-dehydrogenase